MQKPPGRAGPQLCIAQLAQVQPALGLPPQPALTAPLLLLTAACGLLLGGGLAGYLREGAWPRQGRLTVCVQRGLRLHMIWLPRPALALEDRQNPWSTLAQRTNLTLRLPGRVRIRVRSIPIRDAEACLQLLEYE